MPSNRDAVPLTVDQIARFRENGDLIWDSEYCLLEELL